MNADRDPVIEALFARAERPLTDDAYTAQVMARIERRRRVVMLGRFGFVAVLVAFEMLLSAPLQNSVGAFTQALGTALFNVENEWLAAATAPLNSIAGIIGLLLLGLHALYRRMVR